MAVFFFMRILFLLFNGKLTSTFEVVQIAQTFLFGLRLDLSTSAYLTIFPMLLWLVAQFIGNKIPDYVLTTYNIIIIFVVASISIIDAELYGYWGQKLNAYASSFAKFPKEMLSFSGGVSIGRLVFFGGLAIFILKVIYDNIAVKLTYINEPPKPIYRVLFFVLLNALLFLAIRGNLGMSPINQSFAFFSNKPYLNHAAVNTSWNFLASIINQNEDEQVNPYAYITNQQAQLLTDSLLGKNITPSNTFLQLTNKPNPDILLIVLEGWTADVVAFTGGQVDVTPHFNKLAEEALVYENFYANGNRTDKGLAAIISGEPALANSSIINKIEKFTNLPALPKSLAQLGYQSTFVYGGESEFANMKAYWLNSGYQNIVDIHQFNQSIMPENWGVHDDEMYTKLLEQLNTLPSPKFVSALTLSSHEPYKVPHQSIFAAKNTADGYRNSVNYADVCLHKFIEQAKQQPWYKNTLIVIMSDHGHYEPLNRSAFEPGKFHIPFLITGGALNPALYGIKVSRLAQQTDFAAGILQQLNLPYTSFSWSNSLFDTATTGLATYTFTDGIGIINNTGYLVFDQDAKQIILNNSNDSVALLQAARAYEQTFYNQYLKR